MSPAPNQSEKLFALTEITTTPIKGWEEFLREGNEFLATACKAHDQQRQAFTEEILYNLVVMAIEKLIMALLMKSGNLPYNHTMHDLVAAMDEFLPGRLEELGPKLKALDAFQKICDPYDFTLIPPSQTEVVGMIALAREVQGLMDE